MEVKAKTFIALLTFALVEISSVQELDIAFKESLEIFSNNLFEEIFPSEYNENVIYSPLSVHTCLTMARMGAEGETAVEMDIGLALNDQSIQYVANNYQSLLARYESSPYLSLANKVYVKQGQGLQSNYRELLGNKFFSSAEEIDFTQKNKAVKTINSWVDRKTHHMIKELVDPSMLRADTSMLLLSAIHFKGTWEHSFEKQQTQKQPFYIDEDNYVEVDMMFTLFEGTSLELGRDSLFSYIRMPYKDSDLSMMVFAPYKRTGLAKMLEVLRDSTLDDLTATMVMRDLEVTLPKFKVEFGIELNQPLQKLGIVRFFEDAELGKMFKTTTDLSGSKVIHKAVIEVNEEGTEASAASEFDAANYLSPYPFTVDHPFYYVIVNSDNVILFQGAVVNF